jgi:hypothetical protein
MWETASRERAREGWKEGEWKIGGRREMVGEKRTER